MKRKEFCIILVKMRIFILVFISLSCLSINSQEIIFECNRIVEGDSLVQRKMDLKEFDVQGKERTWSLKGIEADKKEYRSRFLEKEGTVIGMETCSRMTYEQTKDGLKVTATEDNLTRIRYDMPEEWLRFPMKQGDSIRGYFHGIGLYCGELFMRRFGTYQTKADSTGKLILPNGETLNGIMRLHTERYVSAVYGDKDTLRKGVPTYTVDSIIKQMAVDTLMLREDYYRWFAAGYRYPILEAKVITFKEKPIEELLFYCLPEEQEFLASNDVNKEVREAVARSEEESQAGDETKTRGEDGFSYEINQNDYSVTIRYQADHYEKITALLTNNQGIVYQRLEKTGLAGSGQIEFNTTGLGRGQYIIYMNVDGTGYAEKFSVK